VADLRDRDYLEVLGFVRIIILKWIFEKYNGEECGHD
jgi:hypothetical protein